MDPPKHKDASFSTAFGKGRCLSLGVVLLATTGTEAMFVDLGHFNALSIRLAFVGFIYHCPVLQYMGHAAFRSRNMSAVDGSFDQSIPRPIFWPVFVVATLASVVGRKTIISATFCIVKRCDIWLPGYNIHGKCLL